jgi:N-acetylmuramoyl-L-alanine amidase
MFLAHKENGGEADARRETPTYEFLDRHSYPLEIGTIVTDLLNSDRVWRSSGIAKALKINWRGSRKSKSNSVRQAPFFVLSQMTTPSALVELGFLTNSEDFNDLTNDAKLDEMADDLYRGLKAFKDSMDKGLPAL